MREMLEKLTAMLEFRMPDLKIIGSALRYEWICELEAAVKEAREKLTTVTDQ